MKDQHQESDATPPGCFRLEELKILQSFENQLFVDVNYYIWLNQSAEGSTPHRFLYALELIFENAGVLLLSSGEDSEAIRLIGAEELLETASRLQQLHGKSIIQRVSAVTQPTWRDSVGKVLRDIRLSKNEAGLFLNDALLLDFNDIRIIVRLSEREGLLAGGY